MCFMQDSAAARGPCKQAWRADSSRRGADLGETRLGGGQPAAAADAINIQRMQNLKRGSLT